MKSYREKGYIIEDRFGEIHKVQLKDNVFVKYNQDGNLIERNEYESDGSFRWKYTYKYDSKGNLIEELMVSRRSEFITNWEYTYDSKGNWIKRIEYYNSSPHIEERTIEYYNNNEIFTT